MTASTPHRFELGEKYRPSQLVPGVIVVRQVSHGVTTASSGSPCCLRTATMDHETITLDQRAYRNRVDGHSPSRPPCFDRPCFDRRCAGCGSKYWIHYDMDTSAPLLQTVEWEVRP